MHGKSVLYFFFASFFEISQKTALIRYQIFVDALANVNKLMWILKRNFTCSLAALRLRADKILVEIEWKIKGGRIIKFSY